MSIWRGDTPIENNPVNLTNKERQVINKLVEAWNAFVDLPNQHPDDNTEFRFGIHNLQRQIMARPIRRMLAKEKLDE